MGNETKKRKKESKEIRKKEIMKAALTLFSEQGYHAVKVDDIAEKVGISKGTVYLYFENKEHLFFAIVFDGLAWLEKKLASTLEDEMDYSSRLKRFVEDYLRFYLEHEALYKIIHSEKSRISMEKHYEMHEAFLDSFKGFFTITVRLIQMGQEAGEIRSGDPQSISLVLVGILNYFIYQQIMMGNTSTVEEQSKVILDYFLNGAGICS